MKLKNIIKIGSFVVAGTLPTTSKAQVYMCQACPAGTYSDGTQTQCTPCPAGTYSNGGAGSCTKCKPGTYSSGGAGQCSPCPSGQYNNTEGASSCQKCSGGTYAGGTGNTSCSRCPDYHWSSAGASSCARIKIRFWIWRNWGSNWQYSSEKVGRWFDALETQKCDINVFGKDPAPHKQKNCGSRMNFGYKEGNNIAVNCRTFPCSVPARDGNSFVFYSDGTQKFVKSNGAVLGSYNDGNVSWW